MHLFIVLHDKHLSYRFGTSAGSVPHDGSIKHASEVEAALRARFQSQTVEIIFN